MFTVGDQLGMRARNIYIVGAQCTGKSTLVAALEQHFISYAKTTNGIIQPPGVILEVARHVLHSLSFTGKNILDSPDQAMEIQRQIMESQYTAETDIDNSWYIADRSAVDALVYAYRYAGDDAVERLKGSDAWKSLLPRLEDALIIVCEPVHVWLQADGLRLMPETLQDWTSFHNLFLEVLNSLAVDYVVVPQSVQNLAERVDFVLKRW